MPTLKEWLAQDPYTLSMSSGFFGFFAHLGLLSALIDADLPPARVTGSSAGALVATCWGAGCTVDTLRSYLLGLNKADFWDPGLGLGLLNGERFRSILREICPVSRLEECTRPVAISAFDVLSWRNRVLERGPLAESVYASCAVPFLFQPIRLNGAYFVDGGLGDRPGLAGIPSGDRVLYHHLESHAKWRKLCAQSAPMPVRDNMMTVVIKDLARSGPHRLDQGHAAYSGAREGMQAALDLCPSRAMITIPSIRAIQTGANR